MGEPDGSRANRFLNELLDGIGSGIRLDNSTVFGSADQRTSDVRAHPLTAGIDSFAYAYVSSVSGGEALFGAALSPFSDPPGQNNVFFATERLSVAAVPEPQSWALMILGFGLAGAGWRRSARPREAVAVS